VENRSAALKGADIAENLLQLLRHLARILSLPGTVVGVGAHGDDPSTQPVKAPHQIPGKLKHYRAERRLSFRNIKDILPQLPANKRGIIYTPQIRQFYDIRQALAERGIEADGFWSVNNMDYNMTEAELEIRRSVVQDGIIPDNVQVLLINAASETGINITSPVDYVVVNDSNPDTQIQAVGRVRHDLETIYLRDLSASKYTYIPHYYLDEKWLNRHLYAEDKEALCRELVIVDERGRRYKWPNIKKTLIYSDFKVTDKRDKDGRRYSIIER